MLPLLLALFACDDPAPTYYADIEPIVSGRCASCHSEGGIGPFVLDDYADVVAAADAVAASVEHREMPPWKAGDQQGYANDVSLTDEQIEAVLAWVEAGMPEGDPADAGEPLEEVARTLPRVDTTLTLPEPYTPEGVDDYRCFLVDWDFEATTYVTGFSPHPDNDAVVHHIAAFLIRPDGVMGESVFSSFEDWEAAEPEPGYRCYGGPGGDGGLAVPVQQLAQWVPGGGAVLLADGTGIEVPAGSKVVVQVHYNTLNGSGPDQTSVDFMVADTVTHLGAFAPWLDQAWPLGDMPIPAGEEVSHRQEADPRAFFEFLVGDLDLDDGFTIHSAMLHMHTLGVSAETWLARSSGEDVTILAIDDYDFDWQLTYELEEPLVFEDGDELGVKCTFVGGAEDAEWGEGTNDEMCVSNLYISEL